MNFDNYTPEQWAKYWYAKGYDDYLNGYPVAECQGSSYHEGWKDAQHDYMVASHEGDF